MDELYKKVVVGYYVAIAILIFSILVMIFAPMIIDDYMWQIMMIPAIFQIPTIIGGRKIIKRRSK